MNRALLIGAILTMALEARQSPIEPQNPPGGSILRRYLPKIVPPVRPGDTSRLDQLTRAGNVYLSAADAIALALENNIDIEVSRYNLAIQRWEVIRSAAGGPLPGVPSGASQAGSVASGQGVLGSQSAAHVTGSFGGQGSGRSSNATISQVGPTVQTLDPSIQIATTFSHTSSPQPDVVQSVMSNLVSTSRAYSGTFSQGFLTGGNVSVSYTDHYLSENAPTDLLNPSVAPNLSLSIQQNLLNGFGWAVNSRNIRVSQIGVQTADLSFRKLLADTTAQVLSAYYSLAADYLDLKAKQSALEVAQTFEQNVRQNVQAGAAAESDLISAGSQIASAERDLADSQASLEKEELQLKDMISRDGVRDPRLATVHLIPSDQLTIPEKDNLPPLSALLQTALAERPDIASDKANELSSEISALGTRNGLLPTLQASAGTSQAGLAGTNRGAIGVGVDRYFVGGIGAALGQMFRRDFSSESGGAIFYTQVGNHQAQADYMLDQLQLRQTHLTASKNAAQVEVDVSNSVIAMHQARAQFEAASHSLILAEQLLEGEQMKYRLGSSTPFAVAQEQRDLIAAQSQELAALVVYNSARINLDLTLGTILETNHISIANVVNGQLSTPGQQP